MAPLVLLHVSDIHFHKKSGSTYDVDRDVRDQLIRDAVFVLEQTGKPSGILVGGDIAFSARQDEYEIARRWLKQLSDAVGLTPTDVWTVPGNHDVDRTVAEKDPLLASFFEKVRALNDGSGDELMKALDTPDSAAQLFRVIESYNQNCAIHFGCELTPLQPFWQKTWPLEGGVEFTIRGVNSAFLTTKKDDTGANRLVLGEYAVQCPEQANHCYAVMCHHPRDWLMDWPRLEAYLTRRTSLQLYGHQHSQNAYQVDQSVVLAAGAVHPDRNEKKWEPTYNVLMLDVVGTAPTSLLRVRVCSRVWSPQQVAFVDLPGSSLPNGHEFNVRIRTQSVATTPPPSHSEPRTPAPDVADLDRKASFQKAGEDSNANKPSSVRRILYDFMELPYLDRLAIAVRLGLVSAEDENTTDLEKTRQFFRRAVERDGGTALGEAINAKAK